MESLANNKEMFKKLSGVTEDPGAGFVNLTYTQLIWKKFKNNRATLVLAIVVLLTVTFALLGPVISGYESEAQDYSTVSNPPSAAHWFGTDGLGRDLFTRVAEGTRVSLAIAFIAAFLNSIIGTLYGTVSAYYGGKVDLIMYRGFEIINSVPGILWVMLLSTIFKPGMGTIIVVLALTGWTFSAQMVRARVLEIKEMEYVLSARTMGAGKLRIILRHLIPNCVGIIIVQMALSVPNAIFTEAMISYIGQGVQAPDASLGTLLSEAGKFIRTAPYQMVFPALFIFLITFCFNLLGDALRDAIDPQVHD